MYYFGLVLYVISTKTYFFIVKLFSLFNPRAKLFVQGRKNLIEKITHSFKNKNQKSIWFHVASLGEFEQARPVIEELKKIYSQHVFVVTFFSPSGYELRKNDPLVDYIFYLPNDSAKNAKKLIDAFNPAMAFWVKYDFWFFYLNRLKKLNIPIYLIDASFNSKHIYFKKYGTFYKKMLQNFTHIFTQNDESVKLLSKVQLFNSTFTGDTRFDRVYQSLLNTQKIPLIEFFKGENTLIVLGSSYRIEEIFMANYLNANKSKNLKIIIAPHFVNQNRIKEIESSFPDSIKFSMANEQNIKNFSVLIIDNIGMLSSIYQYADISFIGGGFVRKGLHNILEAATFGNAIIFGNETSYFPEAGLFLKEGATIEVKNQSTFNETMNLLILNQAYRVNLGNKSQVLIKKNIGSTKKIIENIQNSVLHLK
jgi:3-deoxy-D-manno-octulosonic-acid transferase